MCSDTFIWRSWWYNNGCDDDDDDEDDEKKIDNIYCLKGNSSPQIISLLIPFSSITTVRTTPPLDESLDIANDNAKYLRGNHFN